MNRTKKEVVAWALNDVNVTGGLFILTKPVGFVFCGDDVEIISERDERNKRGSRTIRTYGIPIDDIDLADVLVIHGRYVPMDFEKIKALLDRVFGSSDSWPDEYCDTLGWKLK